MFTSPKFKHCNHCNPQHFPHIWPLASNFKMVLLSFHYPYPIFITTILLNIKFLENLHSIHFISEKTMNKYVQNMHNANNNEC